MTTIKSIRNKHSVRQITRLTFLLLFYLSPVVFCFSLDVSIGDIHLRFDLNPLFKQYKESPAAKNFQMPVGSDGSEYAIDLMMESPSVIIESDDSTISNHLVTLVKSKQILTYSDYNDLMKMYSGPVFYKEVSDMAYSGYERFSTLNGVTGEKCFSCMKEGLSQLSGPFMLFAYIVTSEGILKIGIYQFSGKTMETEKALSVYGKVSGQYLEFKNQKQMDTIYRDMKEGNSRAPTQLIELYRIFDRILASAVISNS